jgi:phosphate acyltransferase
MMEAYAIAARAPVGEQRWYRARNMIRAALDVMGADGGVEPIVAGAAQLSLEPGDVAITLVGDEPAIRAALAQHPHDAARIEVVAADGAIAMTDKPGAALDASPNCSILRAARLVAEGGADVLVSAGNTGAVILACSRVFARLPGVRRVGLAAVHPTVEAHGPHGDPFALMLDVGATLQCEAGDLVAFALMGSCYSRIVSDIDRPRVGLLSNGSEAQKGTPAVVEAHARLAGGALNFAGNVEGLDIPRGTTDVVVCEGFIGNIVLKMLEGVGEVARDVAKNAYAAKFRYKLGLALLSSGLRHVRTLTDWKQYGGAPILGFDRAVIKAHGRSNARAVRNALKVAAKTVQRELVPQMKTMLSEANLEAAQ